MGIDTGLRIGRVAEVLVELPGGGARRGSGYLAAPGRVLTAAHVVAGAARVRVRFDADRPGERMLDAVVEWEHAGVHLAVLGVTGAPDVAAAPFGRVGEYDVDLECTAVGFPRHMLRTDGGSRYRDAKHVRARCSPLSNRREGTLGLRVAGPPPPVAPDASGEGKGAPASPWEGMSGSAVFSGGLIVGVVAEHHLSEGTGHLAASRADRWAELLTEAERRRLEGLLGRSLDRDGLPDVAAEAARREETARGLRPHGVCTQQTVLRRSRRKSTYLTEEQLPFVGPGAGHDADPETLWNRLSAAPSPDPESEGPPPAVLLVGVAGAGKTRTCFEVAALAGQAGWQVLHIEPNAPVSAEQLVEAVNLQRPYDVLLVFDYLDTCTQLDLRRLMDGLAERPRPAGRVACIASVRPGALGSVLARDTEEAFGQVDVGRDEDHQRAVVEGILRSVAGEAAQHLDMAAAVEVCGHRPIIALLLARAVESLVREGAEVPELSGISVGEQLSVWLRNRIGEDFPTAPGAGTAAPQGPGELRTRLRASAVAAASCVQDRDSVEDVVAFFLDRYGDPGFGAGAEGVVNRLLELGWLLSTGDELDVVHDYVTDELLRQTLFPDRLEFQAGTARDLFTAFTVTPRTFRLAAQHVRRWAADLDERGRNEVQRVCAKWLRVGPEGITERLTTEEGLADGRLTLLTLLSGPPWQSGTVREWDRIVRPWLDAAEERAPGQAAELFGHAVRNTAGAVPGPLADAALGWLARHSRERGAGEVAEALVRAAGVPDGRRAEAARCGVEWLRTHGVTWGGQHLVRALLSSGGLPAAVVEDTTDLSLTWISRHPQSPLTDHLLRLLLCHDALDPGRADRVIGLAHLWLDRHRRAERASFVLSALLTRADPDAARTARTLGRALDWVNTHLTSPALSYVLRRLLEHPALTGKRAARACRLALSWLDANGGREEASFVLGPLLPHLAPGDDRTAAAVDRGVDWLKAHATSPNARYVLPRLLEHGGLAADPARRAASQAVAWLAAHRTERDACSVLGPLLKRRGTECGPEAREAAIDWLELHHSTDEASFVLEPLLEHPGLTPGQKDAAAGYAFAWLSTRGTDRGASFVLVALLECDGLGERHTACALDAAFEWLGKHRTAPEARFVLPPVTRPAGDVRAVDHALAWLEVHGRGVRASFVLDPLLRHSPPSRSGAVCAAALEWLDLHHAAEEAAWVLWPLLACPPQGDEPRRRAAEYALARMEGGEEPSTGRLALLSRLDPLPPELGARVAGHVLDRLGTGDVGTAERLLPSALRRKDILPGQADRLAAHAVEWLDRGRNSGRWGSVLRGLLGRTDLTPERARQAADAARKWLAAQDGSVYSARVLEPLLRRGDLGPERRDVVAAACDWLRTHSPHTYTGDLLPVLLDQPGLTAGDVRDCTAAALTWLDPADTEDERMPVVLGRLLERGDLPEPQRTALLAVGPVRRRTPGILRRPERPLRPERRNAAKEPQEEREKNPR